MNQEVYSYLFNCEDDAWDVIGQMMDILDSNGACTMADFCHIVGSGANRDDYEAGWTDLSDITVEKTDIGWHICVSDPT